MSKTSETVLPTEASFIRRSVDEAVEDCFVRTAEALNIVGAADESDILVALEKAREAHDSGTPIDLLEILAKTLGYDEERLEPAISALGGALAKQFSPVPPTIPFAAKLIVPTSFYESYLDLQELGRALLAPVLYVEDTDAVGTGSVNPFAAMVMGEEIASAVGIRLGIKPFVTTVRLDYTPWAFLCRKHFES